MKKFNILLLNLLYSYYVIAQYPVYDPVTISTPNQTSITAGFLVSGELTAQQRNDLKNHWLYIYNNRITFLGEATWSYNCHAYAWHTTEGGSLVWINHPDDDKYWEDCSYIEVLDQAHATKVSYGVPPCSSCDHSAITSGSTDYFMSKWGHAPLFGHHKDDCPYIPNDLNFYARVDPTISGPSSTLCPGNPSELTFTIPAIPPGVTANWTQSNHFSYVSGQGTGTYKVRPITTGNAWVRVELTSSCGVNSNQ
jgi:hypothetical protein